MVPFCPHVPQPGVPGHPPQLWPDDPGRTVDPVTPYADPPKALSGHLSPPGPSPAGLQGPSALRQHSPCSPAKVAQRPPSLPLHSCVAVPPDALHFVPCLAHAGSHVVDATGRLPSIHTFFFLPEPLMVSRAAESTSPDGCCSSTFVKSAIASPH